MLKISRAQAYERFSIMPETLQEALLSEKNAYTVAHVAQLQHVPEDKVYILNIVIGDIIMGFVHFEDAPREITMALSIPPELAKEIWNEVVNRILAPLRPEIEKLYTPPGMPGNPVPAPRIFSEIRRPQEVTAGAKSSETMTMANPRIMGLPTPLSPQSQSSAPPPKMIHEESQPQAMRQAPSFSLGLGESKLKDVNIKRPEPPRPAQIEIGGNSLRSSTGNLPSALSRSTEPAPRVVNYSEFLGQVRKEVAPPPITPPAIKMERPEVSPQRISQNPPAPSAVPSPTLSRPASPPTPPRPMMTPTPTSHPMPPLPPRPPMPPQPKTQNSPVIDLSSLSKENGSQKSIEVRSPMPPRAAMPPVSPRPMESVLPPSQRIPSPPPPASPNPQRGVIDLSSLKATLDKDK